MPEQCFETNISGSSIYYNLLEFIAFYLVFDGAAFFKFFLDNTLAGS